MAASLSFQQAATNGSAASPLAFTCASAAGQERLVALCGIAQSPITSSGFTSVTIDGQAATQVGSTVRTTDPSSNGPVVAFFRAPGTSGTSINVAFTKVGTFFDVRGALWTLSDAGTLLASGTASVNGISGGSFPGPANLNLNTVTGGAVAAITMLYDSSVHDITWTGLTERADATTSLYGGDWFSVADLNVGSTSTPLTVSAATPSTTFSSASAQSALAVSFNPAAGGTTFTAAAGSYVLTGTAAALALRHTAGAGSYALSGTAAAFAYKQSVAAGSYSLTGTAAGLNATANLVFPTVAGSYTLTGSNATFAIASGSFTLFCGSGSYTLSGASASFPGYDPITPPVQPSTGGGYTGGAVYDTYRLRKKRKRDEIEELIDAIQAPAPVRTDRPTVPPPPPPALIDMTAKMQAVGLTPPQRKIVKRAIVSDDDDDDEEAISLLLNLLS